MGIEQYRGRVALVTGASAGIGASIVQALLRHGLVVVGLARRVGKVKALELKDAPGKLHAIKGDLMKEEDIIAAFKWIKDKLGGVDILINNAGAGQIAPPTSAPTEDWKGILDLNVIALSICTREAVKGMRDRGVDDGYIIHISSMLGHIPVMHQDFAMYSASKYAVTALTEGLRKDLVASKTNIRNTTISPGLVKTEFASNVRGIDPEQMYASRPHLLPEDVAEAVVFVLSQPKRVQIHDMLINATGA